MKKVGKQMHSKDFEDFVAIGASEEEGWQELEGSWSRKSRGGMKEAPGFARGPQVEISVLVICIHQHRSRSQSRKQR